MGSFIDKMKKRTLIHWTELDGAKIGLRKLTINEAQSYLKACAECDGDSLKMAAVFAKQCVDENGKQAFTVDDIKECLTDSDVEQLIDEFHRVNGFTAEADELEKN